MLKTAGYLVSIVSVILLGAVAWKGAKDDPAMLAALIVGAVTSVAGMFLRWLSFRRDEKPPRAR